MAISTNTTIVENAPKTFADLKKPEYEGLVALNGDPREAGAAFAAVMAASIANGGSADDIMPGIEFFAELKASGNLGGTNVTQATVLSGETPIAIDWSYNVPGLAAQLEEAGLTVETNFPTDGVYGGFYGQGVVADSPHPACSKLWLEHILSDEGALGYLEGGAMPARYEALVEAGLVDEAAKVNLPPDELISQVEFLTPDPDRGRGRGARRELGPDGRRRLKPIVTEAVLVDGGRTLRAAPAAPAIKPPRNWAWLGLVPFLAFLALFLVVPAFAVFSKAFVDEQGNFGLDAFKDAFTGQNLDAFKFSVRLSALSAATGVVVGALPRLRSGVDPPAEVAAVARHRVQRGGGQPRRRPAGVRVHRPARPPGTRARRSSTSSATTCTATDSNSTPRPASCRSTRTSTSR